MRSAVEFAFLLLVVFFLLAEKFGHASSYGIQNRIAGGEAAELGQFPYQVGIRMYKPIWGIGHMTAWCGGSLIARNLVLTAAHCVEGASSVDIYLGATDLSKEEHGRQVYTVPGEYIIVHERYDSTNARNDIALVNIPQYVTFSEYIQIVNLPRRSQKNETFERWMGWISGWGSLGDGKSSPDRLQYAQRWILSAEYCEFHYKMFHESTQVCVDGTYKISACRGDSGGPLTVIEKDESRTLVGLTSYGKPEGCEKNFPVVFTRITSYLDWIVQRTGISLRE